HSTQDRQGGLALSDDAERSIRLRRCQRVGAGRTHHRWHAAQGRDAGQPQRVPVCARRATGKLLAANKFVKVTWAERVDMATGRRVGGGETRAALEEKPGQVWPSLGGGKNGPPMWYSPLRKLIYVNTMDFGGESPPLPLSEVANLKPGEPHYGVKRPWSY